MTLDKDDIKAIEGALRETLQDFFGAAVNAPEDADEQEDDTIEDKLEGDDEKSEDADTGMMPGTKSGTAKVVVAHVPASEGMKMLAGLRAAVGK